MLDGNSLLPKVGDKYGAPMGRCSVLDDLQADVLLFRMTLIDGDYDLGGAYWGGSGDPMYAAIGEGFQHYMRARSLTEAKATLLEVYPELSVRTLEVNDDFVDGYITAALWSSTDQSDPETGGEPLDGNYEREDLSPELAQEMVEDCRAFLDRCSHLLIEENWLGKGRLMENAGHDFWLTRCGHGCGFWDGDWKEPAASQLTDAAKAFGEVNLFVTGDGRVAAD